MIRNYSNRGWATPVENWAWLWKQQEQVGIYGQGEDWDGSGGAVCLLSHSVVSNPVTPWIAAYQAPLSMGILQVRILEWVAMPSLGLGVSG